jgi:hypothetical protein
MASLNRPRSGTNDERARPTMHKSVKSDLKVGIAPTLWRS